MLGRLNPNLKKTTIVGAGLSGLIAAYKLLKAGHEVEIYERENRVGGLIDTITSPYGPAETAAHSIRATPEVEDFLMELGVPLAQAKTAKRAIFRNGKSRAWPLSPLETIGVLGRVGIRRIQGDQTTLKQFGHHHLGQAATTNLLQPMANGIFAADVSYLDRRAAFPDFKPMDGDTLLWHMIKGTWRTWGEPRPKTLTPQAGMGDLVQHLEDALRENPKCQIHLGTPLYNLPSLQDQNVCLATPAPATAKLLHSSHPSLSDLIRQVTYQPLVSVTLFYKSADLQQTPKGIGVLNSPESQAKSLGILYNSNTFDGRVEDEGNMHSFTMIFGGSESPEICHLSDQDIEACVMHDAHLILGAKEPPHFHQIARWTAAIPRLSPDLVRIWQQVSHLLPVGLCLNASYAGDYSIRQMIQRDMRG